jgi:hypothetical protein
MTTRSVAAPKPGGTTADPAAAVALNFALAAGFAIALVRRLITPGGALATDFSVFWTGWWLIVHGHGSHLYSIAAQTDAQQALMGGLHFKGQLMAFLNPPHIALAGVPFGWLADGIGESFSFAAWTAVSLISLFVLDRWLRESFAADKSSRWVITSALLGFYPVFHALYIGQVSLLLAVAALGLYRADRTSHPWLGAVWLVVLTIKPQLLPALSVFLVVNRRWKLLGYAAVIFGFAFAVTSIALGPSIWPDYLLHVRELESFFGNGTPVHMVNLRGALARLVGPEMQASVDPAAYALWIASAVMVGLVLAYRRAHAIVDTRIEYAFALSIALLASPHLFMQDVVIWAVPVVLFTASLREERRAYRPWTAFVLAWPALFAAVRMFGLTTDGEPRLRIDPNFVVLVMATLLIAREAFAVHVADRSVIPLTDADPA